MDKQLTREVPSKIRHQLRREVGFGCPVSGCRVPFLQYHHFDPEWHVENHHRPEGLIPLCPTHHAQASAWSIAELQEMKASALSSEAPAAGTFQWMKHEIVGLVGGNLYHETSTMIEYRNQPMVWFNRDEKGRALLNVRMLTRPENQDQRMKIVDNDFILNGKPTDLECKPNGRDFKVTYKGGDALRVEFDEFADKSAMRVRFKTLNPTMFDWLDISWPATVVRVRMKVGGEKTFLGPTLTTIPGLELRGSVFSHCNIGLALR